MTPLESQLIYTVIQYYVPDDVIDLTKSSPIKTTKTKKQQYQSISSSDTDSDFNTSFKDTVNENGGKPKKRRPISSKLSLKKRKADEDYFVEHGNLYLPHSVFSDASINEVDEIPPDNNGKVIYRVEYKENERFAKIKDS